MIYWKQQMKEAPPMKKLLCILLMLLLLPAAATAEFDFTPELMPLDMGDFTMSVFNFDAVQLGEKADGALWARIYPAYSDAAAFHDTPLCLFWRGCL